MTKLDSKYLKQLILEVMIGTGQKKYDVPVATPPSDIKGFDYTQSKIPQDLKDKIVDNFTELLGQDPHVEISKIAGEDDHLDWEDFYSILKDPDNLLRPTALLTIRQSMKNNPNSEYSKAFDEILSFLRSDLKTSEPKGSMTPGVGDISDRTIKPPPAYIRNAFLALGLDKTSSLKERIKKITDFSLNVKNGMPTNSTIAESVSSVLILNAFGNIIRTLQGSAAGYSFEDFLSLLSEGTVEGELGGAADFMSGILIDQNGTVSQYGSAKLLGSPGFGQARSTMSNLMPGGATPATLAKDFKGQVLDRGATNAAAQKAAKDKFQKKYGLNDEAMAEIEKIAINFKNIPASDYVYKPIKVPNEKDVFFGNKSVTYVVGYKRKASGVYKTGKKKGLRKPGGPTSDQGQVQEVDIHLVTITRNSGSGTLIDGELSISDGEISVRDSEVKMTKLTSKSLVGTLMLNSSQSALENASRAALTTIDKNIPLLIESAVTFSEKSKESLTAGNQQDLNEMADAYVSLFSLINDVFKSGSRFSQETGSSVGVKTSGDTIKKI